MQSQLRRSASKIRTLEDEVSREMGGHRLGGDDCLEILYLCDWGSPFLMTWPCVFR